MAPFSVLRVGLAAMAAGSLLSGPVALLVVGAIHPQPPWRTAEEFARNYHPLQLLPFVLGLVLVSGCLATIAGLHQLADASRKARTTLALLFAAGFGALIFSNYVLQLTFVPLLARSYVPENGPLLAALSMSNPSSLAWGLEMSGYALFGVATWLCSAVFARDSALSRAAAWCFVVNGPLSIAGAVGTALDREWLLAPGGLAAFAAWNLLVLVMSLLGALAFRPAPRPPALASLAR